MSDDFDFIVPGVPEEWSPLETAALRMSVGLVARTTALKAQRNTVSRDPDPWQHDPPLILPKVAAEYRSLLQLCSPDSLPPGWSQQDVAAAEAFLRVAEAEPGTAEISRDLLAPLFPMATSVTSVNYGSFGGAPLPVAAVQFAIQQALVDGDVDPYMRRRLIWHSESCHRAVAKMMGLDTSCNTVLCDNAADAFNIVAQSIIFNPNFYASLSKSAGEPLRIVLMSNAYPMIRSTIAYWVQRQRALHAALRKTLGTDQPCPGLWDYELSTVNLTLEMVQSLDLDVPALLIDTIVHTVTQARADVFIFEHVSFAPAFVAPVEAICRAIKAALPSCCIIIDAAHAIGSLDLAPLFGGPTPPPFDAWFTNLQKWLMAPKHTALLWFADAYKEWMHPTTISNLYRGVSFQDIVDPLPSGQPRNPSDFLRTTGIEYDCCDSDARRRAEFTWRGTRDHSVVAVLPELIWFRSRFGEQRLRKYNNALAITGARAMAAIFGTQLLVENASALPAMANVELPTRDEGLARKAVAILLAQYSINVPVFALGGHMFIRVSAQVFNDVSVYETVAHRVLESLRAAVQ